MKRNKLIVSIMLPCLITLAYGLFTRQVSFDQDFTKSSLQSGDNINPAQESKPPALKLAMFDIDITPPVGYEMAFDSVIKTWDMGLRAKGLVLLGAGQPVVMCALDWHSIANESQDVFRHAIADLEKLQLELMAKKALLSENRNAQKLAWLQRCQAGKKIDITCLSIGRARILYLPGEMFVEYQLAAKAERPDLFVTMAAYGDFGPHYIGTAVAYDQGGYEVGASDVSPEVEGILMSAIRNLLKGNPSYMEKE